MDETGDSWVALDPATPDLWSACTVVAHASDGKVEVQTTRGERAVLPAKRVLVKNHPEQDRTADLAQLVHLSEPNLLHTLACRYAAQHIYTYTGSILIALNPLRARTRKVPLGLPPRTPACKCRRTGTATPIGCLSP